MPIIDHMHPKVQTVRAQQGMRCENNLRIPILFVYPCSRGMQYSRDSCQHGKDPNFACLQGKDGRVVRLADTLDTARKLSVAMRDRPAPIESRNTMSL